MLFDEMCWGVFLPSWQQHHFSDPISNGVMTGARKSEKLILFSLRLRAERGNGHQTMKLMLLLTGRIAYFTGAAASSLLKSHNKRSKTALTHTKKVF